MKSVRPLWSLVAALTWMGALALLADPAHAADVDIRTGVDPAEQPEEATACFDCDPPSEHGSLLPVEPCHPHRFPHGPEGRAWISVGPGLHKRWKRVVLECRDGSGKLLLRERRLFPESGERLLLTDLPAGIACTLQFRGGEPTTTLALHPGAEGT